MLNPLIFIQGNDSGIDIAKAHFGEHGFEWTVESTTINYYYTTAAYWFVKGDCGALF